MFVVNVGCGDHRAVAQSRLTVHTDVQLHTEIPLLPLAGLVHLGVSGLVGVLGGAGRADDGGVHDGAGVDFDAARLQFHAHACEQGFAQLVVVEQAAEPEHGGGVGHGLATQVDANEAAQAGTVVQGFLAGQVGEVEPVLDEMDAQHALQTDGWTPIACLGVVRCDFVAQRSPRHQRIHGHEKFVAPRGFAMLFKARLCVGRHGKGLLLHGPVIYPDAQSSGDFLSIALGSKCLARTVVRAVSGLGALASFLDDLSNRQSCRTKATLNKPS